MIFTHFPGAGFCVAKLAVDLGEEKMSLRIDEVILSRGEQFGLGLLRVAQVEVTLPE